MEVTHKPFPFLDLKAQFAGIREELTDAVLRVLASQQFIFGPDVAAFEHEVAQWNGSRFAISCASGTDALLLALMALDVGPGDEVITTAFTFVATAGAIVRLGAKPVFVDIDPATFNLDAGKLERAITARTKAVMPVHLFGLMADMDPIMRICGERNIPVVEDAAQAIGAKYKGRNAGVIGDMGCFSFFPSKNLGCAGDGGLITTDDEQLADKCRLLRNHGSRSRYSYEIVGFNSRLDSLQAAVLRVKLPHLNEWRDGRARNAARYEEQFRRAGITDRVTLPQTPGYACHIFNQYTVRVQERDELKSHLTRLGIPSEIYYPYPLHLQPAYLYLGYREGDLLESERAAREVLSLPIYPELAVEDQEAVVQGIAEFYRQ